MRAINLHYFFFFGSIACVQPYLPILLSEQGMGTDQIGLAMSISGWAVMVSPVLVTFLADSKMQPRRLSSILAALAAFSIFAMLQANGLWVLTSFYLLYALALTAMMPLHDGIIFGIQKMNLGLGKPKIEYSKVRVWGTYGYASLLLLLFYPLRLLGSVELALYLGIGCFSFLLFNGILLPDGGRREAVRQSQSLPTGDAFRALFGRQTLCFAASMFLLLTCSAAYHTMYPVYLSDYLGLPKQWVGIVIALGAIIEVYVIHSLAKLEARNGLRRLMLVGVSMTVFRFGLMFLFPNLIVAVGSQIFHGPMICAIMVLPPSYLNSIAKEGSRNSIHGVYMMTIIGTSRIVGTSTGGYLALFDHRWVNLFCAALSIVGLGLLWVGFHPKRPHGKPGLA